MKKILLVEDEGSVLQMLRRFLESEGYLTVTAENGRTALNWLKEIRVDLAIVDLGLPDMNGLEICRRIKEAPGTASIPVVVLTGNTSNEARIEANLDASVELFLNKPISVGDLKKAVQMVFEKSEKKKLLLRNAIKEKLGY